MKYLIGIQPTGRLTLGNYLGCLAKGLRLQQEGHDVNFMIANYHSLTTDSYTDQTENELKRLGCKKITRQNPLHTELFFKLCCKLNLATLLKMPQYKDKKDQVQFDLGLLLYPVLMTADIMINNPDVVIVGQDQVAHLELANDIAKRYDGREFKYELGDVDKIMSLSDPTKKMSKSLGEKHVLYIFDEDYEKKLKKATATDDGLANLKKIAESIGLTKQFDSNLELKLKIAERLKEIFI
jgi:tryptophanyl-tRNA synthetase